MIICEYPSEAAGYVLDGAGLIDYSPCMANKKTIGSAILL